MEKTDKERCYLLIDQAINAAKELATCSVSDFVTGVEWERKRDKWIKLEKFGNNCVYPSPGKYWVVLNIHQKPITTTFPLKVHGLEKSKEWWRNFVIYYQPFCEPELPKKDIS